MMKRLAPFTYDAWRSPEMSKYVSQVAGIDVVPYFDTEIGSINISVDDDAEGQDKQQADSCLEPTQSVAWHFDSFAFVCVTMLSDCQGMVGGETALKTPQGEIMKVRGPSMV